MGSEILRAGFEGNCLESWNLAHPEKVRAIHQAYVDAGARCLVTNTFQSNPNILSRIGLREKFEEINGTAVAIARSAANSDQFILGDIGPEWEHLPEDYVARTVRSFGRADALLFDTWWNIPVGRAFARKALEPAVNPNGIPVLFSVGFRKTHIPGFPPPTFVEGPRTIAMTLQVHARGIAALGVNCGLDISLDDIIHIVKEYRKETDLPIFVRPNAGTPKRVGNQWEYPVTPAMMAERLPELLEAGVSMVGGCCGTTPEHIAAFRPIIDKWNARMK